MKSYLILFIAACWSVTAVAQDDNDRTPYLTKSLANDAITNVMVRTSAGGISVSGRSGEAPRIEVYVRDNHGHTLTNDEIKKRLDQDYIMNVSVTSHELDATVKTKEGFHNWENGLSISFKIYVPAAVSTDLKTSGGGINLDNLKGTETFSTSGGGLQLDKLSGSIHGKTSGGGINVSNSGEDIDLVTSGGGIVAKRCSGTIKLHTSGGGLILEDLKGTIDAHTSGGGIEGKNIEGELTTSTSGGGIDLKNMSCSLDASSSGGSVYAQITKADKYVRLHTSAGNIDIDLPAKTGFNLDLSGDGVNGSKAISGFTGQWESRHVNGTINGGGASIEAHANGEVNVKFN
jgi:hypothetical protein